MVALAVLLLYLASCGLTYASMCERGIAYHDDQMVNENTGAMSAELCLDDCNNEKLCTHWDFSIIWSESYCRLRSSNSGSPVEDSEAVGGAKGCDPLNLQTCTEGANGKSCGEHGSPEGYKPDCVCKCVEGYRGVNCGEKTPCKAGANGRPCGQHGDPAGTPGNCRCSCHHGYDGDNCETALPCTAGANNRTCGKHGTPKGTTGNCGCSCHKGYSGDNCEVPSCTGGANGQSCGEHGTPTRTNGKCWCSCQVGWMGDSCEIKLKLACAPIPPSPLVLWKVVQHPTLNKHICRMQKPPRTNEEMRKDCAAFCSVDGSQTTFPLLIGGETYGFNIGTMNNLCTTIFNPNMEAAAQCKTWSQSLQNIEQSTSKYVAAVDNFEQQQDVFNAVTNRDAKRLDEKLRSDKFKEELSLLTFKKKLDMVKQAIDEWVRNAKEETAGNNNDMQKAISQLRKSGDDLSATVNRELPNFEKFVAECSQDFLGKGVNQEAILDICSQDSAECIEKPDAKHVGCCCGINYVATVPKIHIDGMTASRLKSSRLLQAVDNTTEYEGERFLQADEEHQGERFLQEEKIFDVCAAAKVLGSKKKKDAEDKLVKELKRSDILAKKKRLLKCRYEQYQSSCGGGRRLLQQSEPLWNAKEVANNEAPAETQESTVEEVPSPDMLEEVPSPDMPEEFQSPEMSTAVSADRQLKMCIPQVVNSSSGTVLDECPERPATFGEACLKVAFHDYSTTRCDKFKSAIIADTGIAESSTCGEIVSNLLDGDAAEDPPSSKGACSSDAEVMQGLCKKFCEPIGIPMTFGNEYFGFDLPSANKICLGSLKYDADLVDACARNLSAFKDVKFKTSAVLSQLKVFQTAKYNFVGATRDSVRMVNEYMTSEKFTDKIKDSENKEETFQKELEYQRKLIQENAKNSLGKEMRVLKQKADSLQETLKKELPKLTSALDQCNDLYLAVGDDRSYLLDNCYQTAGGTRCIEQNEATHAGCCCAYNPVSQLGSSSASKAPKIYGTAAIQKSRVGSRRLQSETGKKPKVGSRRLKSGECDAEAQEFLDICAQAWTDAVPVVQDYYGKASKSGKQVMEEGEDNFKSEYDEAYCKVKLETPVTTPGPTQRTTTRSTTSAPPTTTKPPKKAVVAPADLASITSLSAMLPVLVLHWLSSLSWRFL